MRRVRLFVLLLTTFGLSACGDKITSADASADVKVNVNTQGGHNIDRGVLMQCTGTPGGLTQEVFWAEGPAVWDLDRDDVVDLSVHTSGNVVIATVTTRANASGVVVLTVTDPTGERKVRSIVLNVTCPPGTTPPPTTQAPTVTLTANPMSITAGQSSTLIWSSTNATTCSASGGWSGDKPTSGSQQVSPSMTTTYSLTCFGPGGSTNSQATVVVANQPPAAFTITPTNLNLQAPGANCPNISGDIVTSLSATWQSSNPSVATVTSTGANSARVNALSAGNTIITATAADGRQMYVTVTVAACATQPANRTIQLIPAGASQQVGTTLQTQAVCRENGVQVSCNPWWFSSNPSNVSVNPTTGLISFVSSGTAEICVQWSQTETQPRDCATFTTSTSSQATFSISPTSFSLYPPSCPSSGSSTGQFTFLRNGSASSGATWTSSNSNVASVSSSGQVTAVSPGTVSISGSTSEGSATATVTVQACPSTPTTPTITFAANPTSITVGQSSTLTWSSTNCPNDVLTASGGWSGTKSASGSQVVSPSQTTTYTLTCGSVTRSVTVVVGAAPITPRVLSVTLLPETFTCAAGGNHSVSANVEVEGGAPTTVNFSVSNQSMAEVESTAGNAAIIRCKQLGTFTVTARSTFDTSKFDTSTGTVVAGDVQCTWTAASGQQSNGNVIISAGQTITGTATCRNQHGFNFLPYWHSSAPSRVEVRGGQTVVIGGQTYWAGSVATIKGIYAGESIVTVQAAIDETSPAFARKVIVQ